MKKFIVILLTFFCVATMFACNTNKANDKDENFVTITFIQDGEENIKKTINKGESLFDIPNPVERVGYSVNWDRTDFTCILNNITVRAIYTPNEYTITYELNKEDATILSKTQKVKYNEKFTLYIPTCDGFYFNGWKIKNSIKYLVSGKWTYLTDVVVEAQWEKIDDWTDIY